MGKVNRKDVEEVQVLFSQIMRTLRAHPSRKMVAHHTTFAQMKVLWLLGAKGPFTMGEVARMLSVTRPTATSIVDKLVARGLIRRERDEDDRRVVKLKLLPKGTRILSTKRKHFAGRIASILQALSETERSRFVSALKVVNGAVQKASTKGKQRKEKVR